MPLTLCSMRTYTTLVLCLTVFFLFADQNLLAPNLSAIAKDFGFSDRERDKKLGGNISFGFFIIGGCFALVIGYFTDIMNRCMLFGIVVAFGESACLGTYWVRTYPQLFICRVLTGISFGGATPIIFSILGDYYSGDERIYVSTMVGISSSAGVAFGQLISGMIGPKLGWRAPFLIIAIPAIFCAMLAFFTVDEPKRGDQEDAMRTMRERRNDPASLLAHSSEPNDSKVISALHESKVTANHLHTSSNGTSLLASNAVMVSETKQNRNFSENPLTGNFLRSLEGGVAMAPRVEDYDDSPSPLNEEGQPELTYSEKIEWRKVRRLFYTPSVLIIFLQGFPGCLPWGMIYVFLNDYLSEDRHMTVQAATAVLTCFGIGGLAGQLFGGWFGQRLYNRQPQWQCLLMSASTLLSVPPALYVLNARTVGDIGFYFMASLFGFIVNMNGPNVRAVLQNVCMPEIRGTAFSIFTLTDDVGKGLGPALVVLLIDDFGGNRRLAFNCVVYFWLFCGIMLFCLTFTVVKDQRRVQQKIKKALLKQVNGAMISSSASGDSSDLTKGGYLVPDEVGTTTAMAVGPESLPMPHFYSTISFTGSMRIEGSYSRLDDDTLETIPLNAAIPTTTHAAALRGAEGTRHMPLRHSSVKGVEQGTTTDSQQDSQMGTTSSSAVGVTVGNRNPLHRSHHDSFSENDLDTI